MANLLLTLKSLLKHIRAIEAWQIVKISNVGGVLVGFMCWGCFGWIYVLGVFWLEIYECNILNLLYAFTNNHIILYNKHV